MARQSLIDSEPENQVEKREAPLNWSTRVNARQGLLPTIFSIYVVPLLEVSLLPRSTEKRVIAE